MPIVLGRQITSMNPSAMSTWFINDPKGGFIKKKNAKGHSKMFTLQRSRLKFTSSRDEKQIH